MDPSIIKPKNPNLSETTTPIQKKRGNRQFFDKKHKVSYITYTNGYIRREINAKYVSPYSIAEDYKVQDQFVLNSRKSITNQWGSITRVIVKEHCLQARMDMIDRISANYKGYTGRFTSTGHTLTVR